MQSHSFSVDVANVVGDRQAVFLQHFSFWHIQNKANRRNFHDDRYWTYNTIEAFADLYPYLTAKEIRSALERLEKGGYILTGNYNAKPMDRTKWYALTDKGLVLVGEMDEVNEPSYDLPNGANAFDHVGKCILPGGKLQLTKRADAFAQTGRAIPDTNTDTNTDKSLPLSKKTDEADFDNGLKNHPDEVAPAPPSSGRPPAPPEQEPEPTDPDETERLTFTLKLQTNRRLLEGLYKLYKLEKEEACKWIDRFVTNQWISDNLKERRNMDLISHCTSWIEKRYNDPNYREQRPRNTSTNNAGSNSSATGYRSGQTKQTAIVTTGAFGRRRQNLGDTSESGNG